MRITRLLSLIVPVTLLATAGLASAQTPAAPPPAPPAYGAPITLEQAKKVLAGAQAEAQKNNWGMVIVVLDSGGNLVALHRMDTASSAASRWRGTRHTRPWPSDGPPRPSRTRSRRAAPTFGSSS